MEASIRIERVGFSHPDALRLIEEVQLEYVERYGGRDDTPIDATMFTPPEGRFCIAYLDGEPVATGAWRRREAIPEHPVRVTAELKRMYVAPRARHRGVARALLAHLEATAQELGAEVMVLETGMMQPEAIALYEASGYQPVAGFGHYRDSPLSRCFAKRLTPRRDGGPATGPAAATPRRTP